MAVVKKTHKKRLKNYIWGHIVNVKHYICSTAIKTHILQVGEPRRYNGILLASPKVLEHLGR